MMARVYYYEDDALKVQESLARYGFAVRHCAGMRVLDVGCGARRGPRMAAAVAESVVGTDICEEAVGYCRRKWPVRRARYLVADGASLPFAGESFDRVLSLEVIEHVARQEEFLAEARRVLKRKGLLVLSTPNRAVMSPTGEMTNPDHVREFSLSELKDLLSAFFEEVEIWGQAASRRVSRVQENRTGSLDRLSRFPQGLRRICPSFLKKAIFRIYSEWRLWRTEKFWEEGIGADDFPVTRDDPQKARYFIAICRK
jgi:2-polyprenyl-3-methyl-5-hydroxy-6-metoxy-1,4-benzoquinol methylase